jgi:hypothetical protein
LDGEKARIRGDALTATINCHHDRTILLMKQ